MVANSNSNPPLSPFYKGGIFSVGFSPLFGKEGKGRFLGGVRQKLYSELLDQDTSCIIPLLHYSNTPVC